MPYLKLVESASQRVTEVREAVVRLGHDPAATIVFTGGEARVVSARHAEIRYVGGEWRLADAGSTNGTYLNGRRLEAGAALKVGDVITLGAAGPKLSVAAVAETLAPPPTVPEHPANAATAPLERPAESRAYAVTLLAAATGKRHEARGTRIRLGRGTEWGPDGELGVDA